MPTNNSLFTIGNLTLSLEDLQAGLLAVGSIGTGKTVSYTMPLFRQCTRQLNDEDPTSPNARFGGLIIDPSSNLTDAIITELSLAQRSLNDLLILDPQFAAQNYNPIDPALSPQENAEKLLEAFVATDPNAFIHNPFWHPFIKTLLQNILILSEISTPKTSITLHHIADFLHNEEQTLAHYKQARQRLEEKHENHEINQVTYTSISTALDELDQCWFNLSPTAQGVHRKTLLNILNPITKISENRTTFCSTRTIDFASLINEGKILIFQAPHADLFTIHFIGTCLKSDYQRWISKRASTDSTHENLNTTRSMLLLIEDVENFIDPTRDHNTNFLQSGPAQKSIAIFTTNSLSSLYRQHTNSPIPNALIQAIATHILYRTNDPATIDFGTKKSGIKLSTQYSKPNSTPKGFVSTLSSFFSNVTSADITVSTKHETTLQPEDIQSLQTVTSRNSSSGPFFSEAIAYAFRNSDRSTKIAKVNLPHLYYDIPTKNFCKQREAEYFQTISPNPHFRQVKMNDKLIDHSIDDDLYVKFQPLSSKQQQSLLTLIAPLFSGTFQDQGHHPERISALIGAYEHSERIQIPQPERAELLENLLKITTPFSTLVILNQNLAAPQASTHFKSWIHSIVTHPAYSPTDTTFLQFLLACPKILP